jgi:hypothetical protein
MDLSSESSTAIGIVAAGLFALAIHRKLPPGLGPSLFVGAVSLAVGVLGWNRSEPAIWNLFRTCRLSSALCLLWAILGWFTSRERAAGGEGQRWNVSETFFAWSLVVGIGAFVLTVYQLLALTWHRVLNPIVTHPGEDAGLWDVAALLAATFFWVAARWRPVQATMLLVVSAMLVWWSGIAIGSAAATHATPAGQTFPLQPNWWTWVFQIQFGLTGLLVISAVFQDWRHRVRRRRAWPDRLDDLLEEYYRWPFFIESESMISAAILVIGVYLLVQIGDPSGPLALATGFSAFVAGVTCMFLTYRRWSSNTAGLGMSLLTLAAVQWGCAVTIGAGWAGPDREYADRIPPLFTTIILVLALMVAWWRWLAAVWDQQLLERTPWTTTGRMIRYVSRLCFFLTALAMLMAFQTALWPVLVFAGGDDATAGRFVSTLAAFAAFVILTTRLALRRSSNSSATMATAFVVAAFLFVFVRLPPAAFEGLRGRILQYSAVVQSAMALPLLIVAESILKTAWRPFATPLWLMALLVLPVAAMLELLTPRALPAEWVRPATLAVLGGLYGFAGSREHRRAFLVLCGVLLLASLISLFRAYGPFMMPSARAVATDY